MNDYVEFYTKNCLHAIANRNDKSEQLILNNIKPINYEDAVKLTKSIVINDKVKPVLLLSEEEFTNSTGLKKYLEKLDAKKLWKLCVLLYAMVAKKIVVVTRLTSLDEYIRLYVDLKRGLEITSITVKGTMNEQNRTYNVTNDVLMADMCKMFTNLRYGLAINTINNDGDSNINNDGAYNYSYEIDSFTTIDKVVDKRVISYMFAKELECFIKKYLVKDSKEKVKDLNSKQKMLILEILYLFGQFKNNPPSNTDNYRKLMSDGKKLLKKQTINNNYLPLEDMLVPIILNPESIKIREEFDEIIKKGRVNF